MRGGVESESQLVEWRNVSQTEVVYIAVVVVETMVFLQKWLSTLGGAR